MVIRKYLITGGTSSIGEKLIEKISLHEEQSTIYFTYNNDIKKKNLLIKKFKNTIPIRLNLKSKKSILNLKKINSKIDSLVLCAAATKFIPINNYSKLTPEKFEKITNINLISQYSIVYYLCKNIKKNGNIIFLSSIASKNAIGSNCAYSASKAAINNLVIFFSKAFQGKINVNAVAPGLMHTKLTSSFSKKYFSDYAKKTNSKKLTKPSQVAELIYFILNGSKNINGQTLFIDGGSI